MGISVGKAILVIRLTLCKWHNILAKASMLSRGQVRCICRYAESDRIVIATVGVSGEQPRYPFRNKVSFEKVSIWAMGSETVLRTKTDLEMNTQP